LQKCQSDRLGEGPEDKVGGAVIDHEAKHGSSA
jgi:hypothetical protein